MAETFDYDLNGNLSSHKQNNIEVERFEYDVRNQLTRVANGANTELAKFDYDFERKRLSKTSANFRTDYVYAGNSIVSEFQNNIASANYTIGAGEIVKSDFAVEGARYYFSDALGSTTSLADNQGSLIARNEYDAFGVQSSSGNTGNAIGYTGQRLDYETGLMALGNGERYYSPSYARFIQQDSVSGNSMMPQSLNRFAYAHNNPLKYTDPSGNIADDNRGSLANSAREFGLNKNGDNGWINIYLNWQARNGYDLWDTISFGALSRQEEVVAKYENHEITATQWKQMTVANAVVSGGQAALMFATGGAGTALTAGAGLATRVVVGAGLGVAEKYLSDSLEMAGGFRENYGSATEYAIAAGTGGLFGAASGGRAKMSLAKEGKLTLGTELKLLGQEAKEFGQTTKQIAKAFAEGVSMPTKGTNTNMLGGQDIVERLSNGVNNALKSPALENSPYHPDRVTARVNELWNKLYSKKPWKEGFYHGKKPKYSNEGHHDRSSKSGSFRGGGNKTTELPSDAEQVYRNAIPDPKDSNTWWGRNSEGEYYRYQGSQQGEDVIVHWNGRQNSSRGLPTPSKEIRNRFERK